MGTCQLRRCQQKSGHRATNMNEKSWYLKKCPLFSQLTPDQLGEVEASCFSREFSRGDAVYLPSDMSDSVLLLARGRVRIYHVTSEGKQAILSFIEPGEMFGELAMFEPSRREDHAEAVEKSLVVLVPGNVLHSLMNRHPHISMSLTRLYGLRLRRIERRLKSLLFRSSRDRLVHLLLELAEKYGQQHTNGLLLNIKISHQDMASAIGATRETVTITLGELQNEGLIRTDRRKIFLQQPDRLSGSIDFGAVQAAVT
jgi:CRP/FNR family cyclic AMP-dependent transcriptional regulator